MEREDHLIKTDSSRMERDVHSTETVSRETEETLIKTLTKISAVKIKTATAVTTDRAAEDVIMADAEAWIFRHLKNH